MVLARDMKVTVVMPQVVIRQDPFYTGYTVSTMGAEWKSEPLWSTAWDQVHFYEVTGHAWGNCIGKEDSPGPFSCGALQHEAGHNWDAVHLAYQADAMWGNEPAYGPFNIERTLRKRQAKVDNGTLSASAGYSDPLHPFTHVDIASTLVDTPVDIDVLSNDWDSNGDTLSILGFTATTVTGGTVVDMGNGVIRYTPAAGYVGKDMIVYTVQDDSSLNLKARDIVHIEVVNQDLALKYDFEETLGTNLNDSSGVGIGGKLNGGYLPAPAVAGPDGQAISAADGSITVGYGSVLPVPGLPTSGVGGQRPTPFEEWTNVNSGDYDPMDESYTWAFWFKNDDPSVNRDIVNKWAHSEQQVGFRLAADTNGVYCNMRQFQGISPEINVTAAKTMNAGEWYHVALVFDRNTDDIRIYIDGRKVGENTTALDADSFIFMGRTPIQLGLDGSTAFDDFRIYTRALSDADVQGIVNGSGKPIEFIWTYEAEDAVLSGAVVASNQGGYTGTGFADYLNASNDYVEWTVNMPSRR